MKKRCPECGNKYLIYDDERGEIVCSKCGRVLEESVVDLGQDWRAFDSEQRATRARAGAPLTHKRHDKGLSTEIGKGAAELFKVSPRKRGQFFRIRMWQKRLLSSKDRNLSYALSELQRLVSFLGLPETLHEEAAKLYEKALEKNLIRGRSIESIISALLYALAREYGTPRTLAEMAQATGISKRELGRTYRYISRKMDIRILPARAETYIPRFASMLKLSDKTQMRAIKILKDAKNKDVVSGKGPCGCAAAAIYIASVLEGERKTQREIADVVGVTEVTIRNRYKEIAEALNIEEEVERIAREEEEKAKKEKQKGNVPIEEIKGISKKAAKVLKRKGIRTAKDLAKTPVSQLTRIKGVGKRTAERYIKEAKKIIGV